MSLRFPYQLFPVKQPLKTLSGRKARPRPIIPVTIIGPFDSRLVTGILDPASDDTVFSDTLASKIGVDLTSAPTIQSAGVGLVPFTVRLAEVTLRIADDFEQREWKAWVGFTSAPLRQSLLGFAGFLQFFTATFRGDSEEVELTINSSYAGS